MQNVFMERAIELAKKGQGLTAPNPCVGAVIVKGGQIIAEGWHQKAGEPHAETLAINEIMQKSGITTMDIDPTLFHNATLYVTLEPCSHTGKTGPCSNLVVKAGFNKVCVGMKDPSKKVNGKGLKAIRRNGIKVEVCKLDGKLSRAVRALNQPFIKTEVLGLPYVILKAGMSLDGKVATSDGNSKWITGPMARKDARIERSMCDAVIVGSNTVKADDPELAAHGKFAKTKLLRVIIDKNLSTPPSSHVFRDENVFVATTKLASAKARAKFDQKNIKYKNFGTERVSIKRLLKYLAKQGVQSVFVEGGSGVHGSFYDAYLKDKTLVDKFLFYIAPRILGGKKSLPVIGGKGVDLVKRAVLLEDSKIEKVGENFKFTGVANFY